jgi:dTDP-3-amino-3,4,6-trideoxy-alpha-D-glucose transaminase
MPDVLFNDFKANWDQYGEEVLQAIDRVGRSGWLVLGDEVSEFERLLAAYWGLDHCVGCASGLDALELSLRASGLEAGQKVLTTPLSAFATSLAITRAGGVPIFVDVDKSGQIDLDLCRSAMRSDSDLRYLVPVHLFGHAIDLEQMTELRDQFSLTIIEDCAQAIAAKSRGNPVGSVGAYAATSFYPTKNLGCMGDGGAILTDDAEGARRLRSLRDYGQSEKFKHTELGLNSRLDEIQAALLGSVFLPVLDRTNRRRGEVAARYCKGLANPLLQVSQVPNGSESVWHLFPVTVEVEANERLSARKGFRDHLQRLGIQTAIHYPVLIPDQAALSPYGGEELCLTELPEARRFAESEVSLPVHPLLSDQDVDRVIEACNRWRQ